MKLFETPTHPEIILPPDRRRVLIAWNPRAGMGRRQKEVRRIQQSLTEKGFACSISNDLNEVSDLAHQWYEQGDLRTILGSGGDGTVRELAERSPVGTPIAVFPAGTANLLSKYLWRRRRVTAQAISRAVECGHASRFDAGIANGRLFVLMCSCGFDAAVVAYLHTRRRGRNNYGSYLKPLVHTCRTYEYPEMSISASEPETGGTPDGVPLRTRWAFVFNFPCYAVGSAFARSAEPRDGILDLCAFSGVGFWPGLWFYFHSVLFGREMDQQCILRTPQMCITSRQMVPYQIDGDPGGNLPLEITTAPNRLTLLIPPVE